MIIDLLKSSKGQAVVEFTLGFLLFITMFLSIIEFSHLLYAKLTMQHALREAGRYMVTGRTAQDGQGNSIPRPEAILKVFCAYLIASGLQCPDLAQFEFACANQTGFFSGSNCTNPGGGPEQTVMATVTLSKHALFPFFRQFFSAQGVTFQLSTTWKNEPFQSS